MEQVVPRPWGTQVWGDPGAATQLHGYSPVGCQYLNGRALLRAEITQTRPLAQDRYCTDASYPLRKLFLEPPVWGPRGGAEASLDTPASPGCQPCAQGSELRAQSISFGDHVGICAERSGPWAPPVPCSPTGAPDSPFPSPRSGARPLWLPRVCAWRLTGGVGVEPRLSQPHGPPRTPADPAAVAGPPASFSVPVSVIFRPLKTFATFQILFTT